MKEGNFGATARLGDRLSARLTAGAAQEPEWARSGGIVGGQRDFERVNANLDVVAQVTDKLEARVEAGWSNVQQTDVGSSYNYIPSKYLTHSVKGALAWDSQYGLLQLTAYQNDLKIKADLGSGANTVFENTIKVVSLQDLFKIGAKHTFRVGAEYRQNEMPTAPMGGGVISYDVLAFSGMWNWQVRDDFALTAALRNDSLEMKREGTFPAGFPGASNSLFDRSIEETSWNLGAVWNVTDVDTLRATYARGVQVPTLMSLGGLQLVFPGVAITGNPTIDPTLVTNYGLAYERALPKIGGKASVRLFFQESEAVRGEPAPTVPAMGGSPAINTYVNVSDSELKGVELLAEGAYENGVHWKANYTYTDIEDDAYAGIDLDVRLANYADLTPKHRANLNVGWADAGWAVDGFLRYESEKVQYGEPLLGSPRVPVDAFVTLGGRVARDFDNGVTIAVAGQNLLDERQRQTAGLEVERRAVLSLTKTW
jgi:iron complex outermembrane receptor protein